MSNKIHYLIGFSLKDIVSQGNIGMVCLNKSSQTIIKSPYREENEEAIVIKRRIYKRISKHGRYKGLLRYYSPYESGIQLEFVYNNTLRSFIRKLIKDINIKNLQLCQARQIIDTLRFLYSKHIIHRDLTYSNIFLDEHLNTKLGNFDSSSLDRSPLLIEVIASYKYPRLLLSI